MKKPMTDQELLDSFIGANNPERTANMTRKQQLEFIRDLTRNITSDITAQIKANRIPPEWDGHELRMLLAERAAQSGRMSMLSSNRRSKRALAYRNTVIINNLL